MKDVEKKDRSEYSDPRLLSRRDFLKLLAAAGLVAGCGACQPAVPGTDSAASEGSIDFSRISYCGIHCQEACPEWAYPQTCDGCKAQTTKCAPYCCGCPVRKCAREKEVLTCAHCNGFPTCDKETWNIYPGLRKQIEQLRAELQTQP